MCYQGAAAGPTNFNMQTPTPWNELDTLELYHGCAVENSKPHVDLFILPSGRCNIVLDSFPGEEGPYQVRLNCSEGAEAGANQQELLDQLRSENEYLRNKLDDSDGARVRSDTIIMQLTQQLERTQLQLDSLRETTTLWQRVKSIFLHKPA